MSTYKTKVPDNSTALKEMMGNAVVLDLETTINAQDEQGCSFAASPFSDKNYIVAWGLKETLGDVRTDGYVPTEYYEAYDAKGRVDELRIQDTLIRLFLSDFGPTNGPKLIIGHNIAFDLQYLMNNHEAQTHDFASEILTGRILIWDTMLAEYYLTNQRLKSPSLEKCCELRNIDFVKDKTVSDSFKLGIGADKIHPTLLKQYLQDDVMSTEQLFLSQHNEAVACEGVGYIRYLIGLMTARVTTAMMEQTGSLIDMPTFESQRKEQADSVELLRTELVRLMELYLPTFIEAEINPASANQIKAILYGGPVKTAKKVIMRDEKGLPVKYKSGVKKGEVRYTTQRDVDFRPDLMAHWGYKYDDMTTDDKRLQDVLNHLKTCKPTPSALIRLVETLLQFRTLNKNLTTYYDGMEKHIWHNDTVHPQYNHGVTATKRLSSSKPNMQNFSNKGKD